RLLLLVGSWRAAAGRPGAGAGGGSGSAAPGVELGRGAPVSMRTGAFPSADRGSRLARVPTRDIEARRGHAYRDNLTFLSRLPLSRRDAVGDEQRCSVRVGAARP